MIVEWDPTNAANKVRVGAAILEDLNIFNSTEASQLKPGDVVGILTVGPSWFILGRLTVPRTPAAASSLAAVFSRIVAATDPAEGTRASSAYGDLTGAAVGPSVTVNISPAGRALAFWKADYGHTGTWSRITTGGISVAVSGATARAASADYSLGHFLEHPDAGNTGAALIHGGNEACMMHLFEDLNPGLNTFTMKYRNREGSTPVRFSAREIAVFAM
ncbi:MAG TPA: hypothetical protein VFX60_12680 [Micromonospora sp.]|nr:hypothetical protein [Micromonospora sp.]